MFVRNFLTAGDYLIPVPFGLRLTLQYDDKGLLEKVYEGYDKERSDITESIIQLLLKHNTVPSKINIKNGTTWVTGVLHAENAYLDSQSLPITFTQDIRKEYEKSPKQFTFYAAEASSLAAAFKTSSAVKQWLNSLGFQVLPGYVVSNAFTETTFKHLLGTMKTPVKYPFISDYIVRHIDKVTYYDLGMSQRVVDKIDRITSVSGELCARLTGEDLDITVDVAELYVFNIHEGDTILLDETSEILANSKSTSHVPVSGTVKCPVCGRMINLVKDQKTKCSDPHCNSVLYPQVCRFVEVLNLPVVSKDRYDEITAKIGNVFSIPDVLDFPEIQECVVHTTIPDAIMSLLPRSYAPKVTNIMKSLVNRCNNSADSVLYYLQNPTKVEVDLDIKLPYEVLHWLQDLSNVADVSSLLSHPRLDITCKDQTFDGAPIFRGRTILITGLFTHGSFEEVSSILRSYSATVVSKFTDDVNCVIIGGTHENISSSIIKKAKKKHVAIFEEADFFMQYDIDKDLAEAKYL